MSNVPAFPTDDSNNDGSIIEPRTSGMSLRDYFAAKIIPMLNWSSLDESAKRAYLIADAMLHERNNKRDYDE